MEETIQLLAAYADNCAILDGLSDAILVIGLDYRIQLANRAARALSAAGGQQGLDAAALLGKGCGEVFGCQRGDDCPAAAVLATGETVKVTHARPGRHDGAPRFFDVIASPHRDASGRLTGVIESRRDVTEERSLEEALVRRHEELSILHTVARTLTQSLDLGEMLGRSLDEVLRLTGIDSGARKRWARWNFTPTAAFPRRRRALSRSSACWTAPAGASWSIARWWSSPRWPAIAAAGRGRCNVSSSTPSSTCR
jgi:PAS domain S-box-containing protein